FDDRVTGRLDSFAPNAQVIHADIDPAEIGKNRDVEVATVSHARAVLAELLAAMPGKFPTPLERQREPWWRFRNRLPQTYPPGYARQDQLAGPQYVISRISALTGPEAVYAAGVGQHQMWAAQFIVSERPKSWLNSGGLGTMG